MQARDKQTRAAQRASLGPLNNLLVLPRTLRLYENAVALFFAFMSAFGFSMPSDVCDFDDVVSDYIEHEWESGEQRNNVGRVLSGLQHFVPGLKGHLKLSWRLFQKWSYQEQPVRAPPFTEFAALAICHFLWKWGFHSEALATALAFYCFLRPGEMFSLRRGLFHFRRNFASMHIVLPCTKTSRRNNTTEAVVCRNRFLVKAFSAHFEHRDQLKIECPNFELLSVTPAEYRSLFAAAVSEAGLPPTFKPYSLRRGGASHFFALSGRMDQAMETGRWRDARTARIYINSALLELTSIQHLETTALHEYANRFLRAVAGTSRRNVERVA